MLFSWLVTPIVAAVVAVLGTLPTVGGDVYGVPQAGINSSWTWISDVAYFVNLPAMATLLALLVLGVLPALFVFELAQWGYRELPDIMGIGPS